MFLYPTLTIGFLFVAVPLLVHLINMLRHRRQRWAAMDFLLSSFRKQKKWIRLRQFLLLLSRLAIAALLIAMLCGWSGGGQMLGLLGGRTTHHIVVLDDSYSMADTSIPRGISRGMSAGVSRSGGGLSTAYGRSLGALQDLARRLAADDGNHQLTVMRASRATMVVRGGSESGDAAADLSAQTITSDARLINRVMATTASSIRTDLVPALDLAAELIDSTPADSTYLYIASDFRKRDWDAPQRLAEAMRGIADGGVEVRMIDCAATAAPNLAITDVAPAQDVWVAGVPVVVDVTVRNYGSSPARNVAISSRVIRYPRDTELADPTLQFSGEVETLPAMMIESIEPGAQISKSFQVYVTQQGTHAIEVSLSDDALAIDNVRSCTLPLSDAAKVLVIDNDPNARGAYHVASVLDPGSQVRIGAIPDVQPPSFLRSVAPETLAAYRAVYLIDLPEISENAASALADYVKRGGGLAWFLGADVRPDSYNQTLLGGDRNLLPAPLSKPLPLPRTKDESGADVVFAESIPLMSPLRGAGDAVLSLIGVSHSWGLQSPEINEQHDPQQPRVRVALKRRDGLPWVTQHDVGQGRVITVLTGLDGRWTNWPGDPTFVVFLLQSNALLWSGAAPPTFRYVDDEMIRRLPHDSYAPHATYLPATGQPPRVPIEVVADPVDDGGVSVMQVGFNPQEMVIDGEDNVDEILRPGISEWMLTRSDGRGEVVPVASVIRAGEGDLARADAAEIQQKLLPLEVRFMSSSEWSEENQAAGSSALTLLLLGLLGTVLAGEQLLAYWAGYHMPSGAPSSRPGDNP